MDDDIVLSILRMVNMRAPSLPTDMIIDIEREARLTWGGSRPYVPKASPTVGDRTKAQRGMWRSSTWIASPRRQRG